MAIQPAPIKRRQDPPPLRMEKCGGVDFSTTLSQIEIFRSPDMLNIFLDERGLPEKCTGYDRLFATSLGAGEIHSQFEFKKRDGTLIYLLHHGTKLYHQTGTAQPVEIYASMADAKSKYFVMGDKCYIMDGTNYLVLDAVSTGATALYLTAHGLSTNDLIVNTTRSNAVRAVTKVDNNQLTVASVTGQTFGDAIKKYAKQANGTAEAGTTTTNIKITGHGLATGDYIRNTTRSSGFLAVTVVDVDNMTVAVVVAQTDTDTIELYKFSANDVAELAPPVAPTPYVPTLTLGRAPTGGGTAYEQFNLMGAGFKDSFSAAGAATAYQLSLTGLDATAVTAVVNGTAMVETTNFTVNRTTGVVTFLVAPTDGTNNVVITAYKTQTGFADRIKKCTNFVIFGGDNDTRIHITGNPDYLNQIWRCALYDPTYWAENAYSKVGSDAGKILGFAKQDKNCVVIKEFSPNDTMVWSMSFVLTSAGVATFPIEPINYNTGCKAVGTILLVNNSPTWLSGDGCYRLTNVLLNDRRNTEHISERVDRGLLAESNLEDAVSVDYDKKYWVVVNDKAYIWDYNNIMDGSGIGEWLIRDNIPASCFLERSDGYLYFGSNVAGLVYKLKKDTDTLPYNDDGAAITAYRDSKLISMDLEDYRKMVSKIHLGLKPNARTSCDLYFRTEKNDAWVLKDTFSKYLFSYAPMGYAHFSYLTSRLPQPNVAKIKSKKTVYYQTRVKNAVLNESMGITYQTIEWHTQGKVK